MRKVFRMTAMAVLAGAAGSAAAVTFETESVSGSFDSTISFGLGVRTQDPSCNLVVAGASGKGAPGGCTTIAGVGDQGNINYAKGDAFTLSLMSDGKVSINVYTILFIALFGIGYGAYYATADRR